MGFVSPDVILFKESVNLVVKRFDLNLSLEDPCNMTVTLTNNNGKFWLDALISLSY